MSNQRNQEQQAQESSLAQIRRQVASIESQLVRGNERLMTDTFVSQLEAEIRAAIMAIRHAPAETVSREVRDPRRVLEHLRDARDQLSVALDLFDQEGQTPLFSQQVLACKHDVQQALACW